jgi:hypothetical protein
VGRGEDERAKPAVDGERPMARNRFVGPGFKTPLPNAQGSIRRSAIEITLKEETKDCVVRAIARTVLLLHAESRTNPRWIFDYSLVESMGLSGPLPVAEPRLGRRTVLTFPLLPPPQKN